MSKNNWLKQDKALDRQVKGVEKELIANYQTSLKTIRGKIAKLYEKTDGTFNDAVKFNRLANLEKSIIDELRVLTGKNAKTLNKGVADAYREAFYRTGFVIENEVGARLSYGLINADTVRKSIENPLDRVGFVNRHKEAQDTLARQLKDELTQGLIQGKSYGQTAKSISERMNIGVSKAVRIVQTESGRVRSQAKLDSMGEAAEAGVVLKKQWLSTLDGSTRESHQSLDGVTIDLDEDFVSDDGNVGSAPGQFGDPAEDINCRCQVISVIENYEPKTRKARDEFEKSTTIPYATYKEWKENLK